MLAGADYDIGVFHMGRTNLWTVQDTGKPTSFPKCPWAIDLSQRPFPGRDTPEFPPIRSYDSFFGWFWESGFNHDPIRKGEWIRDNNFRAMYGAWDAIKNVDKDYPTHEIRFSRWISGKRESRRLMGDVILTAQDLKSGREFEDGVVPLSWRMDFHLPHPHFFDSDRYREGSFYKRPFISHAPHADDERFPFPYWLPYRTLYSRNVPNLFMAGRNISVTLAEPIGLAGGHFYMSFLAQQDGSGRFRIETSNGKHIPSGLEVTADGAVTAQGATVKTSSTPGLFKANTPYLVVLKFSNAGGKTGAVARVKLFEVGADKLPARQRGLQWDVVTAGGQTGVLQDRVILSVSQGNVMIDELRLGFSWESVTTQGALRRNTQESHE